MKPRYFLLLIVTFIVVYLAGCGDSTSLPGPEPDWRWASMNSGTTKKLNAVWSVYIGDIVYAVGENGTILKYEGYNEHTWSQMSSPTTCSLKGVWGANESSVYAVGEFDTVNNKYTLLKYNGSGWAKMDHTPLAGSAKNFNAIWGESNTNIIAVGDKISGKFDGGNWAFQSEALDLRGIWGDYMGGFYAGGADWVSPGENINNNIFTFADGTPWTWAPNSGTGVIRGVWVCSSEIFAVGDNGLILHKGHHLYSSWEKIESGTSENLNAVNGDSINGVVQAFIVGDHGTILHFDGNSIRKLPSGVTENLYGITYSSGRLYAVGDYGMILKGAKIW